MRAYASVLGLPGAAGFMTAGLVARIPIGMRAVGTILLVSASTGSFALAGAVAATVAVATAVAAPAIGGLSNRYRQSTLIFWTLPAHVAATVTLVLLVAQQAPTWALFAAAAIAGLTTVPIGSLIRTRWSRTTTGTGYRSTAYALEGILDEVIYITGPVLVTALAVGVNPTAGLLGALALYVLGSTIFALLRRTEPPIRPASAPTTRRGPLNAGVPVMMAVYLLAGFYLGTLDIGIIAFSEEQQSPASAGILLGLLAAGSAISGLAYGARSWPAALPTQLLAATVVVAAGSLPLLAAGSVPAMGVLITVAGLGLSPLLISANSLVGDIVAERSLTQGLAWLSSAIILGMALGAGAGGALVDRFDSTASFSLGAAGAVLTSLTAALGLRTLRRSQLITP